MNWREVQIPERMSRLERHKRGLPIPPTALAMSVFDPKHVFAF